MPMLYVAGKQKIIIIRAALGNDGWSFMGCILPLYFKKKSEQNGKKKKRFNPMSTSLLWNEHGQGGPLSKKFSYSPRSIIKLRKRCYLKKPVKHQAGFKYTDDFMVP